jgi:hypothetical protein
VIYLETGDYIVPDAAATIDSLVEKVVASLATEEPQLSDIPAPSKMGALAPLSGYLDLVGQRLPEAKILIILDEFDTLPREIFSDRAIGNSFFQSIRSISGKQSVGFILVGGENLEPLIRWHWESLNKFRPVPVGYLDRERDWTSFQELVRNPVANWLDIETDAIAALFEQTAGHPYYTKLVCDKLFTLMVDRHDAHVTRLEVATAVEEATRSAGRNSFEHFWVDGLTESDENKRAGLIMTRQKVLITFSEVERRRKQATEQAIVDEARNWLLSESSVREELREFSRRGVLVSNGARYECRVGLFQNWLIERGADEIAADSARKDAELKQMVDEREQFRVREQEIIALTESWDTYRGRPITAEHVRMWLDQFTGPREQRAMFKVLQSINYFTRFRIRERLREAHLRVLRGLTTRIVKRERSRKDILIGYPGGEGKSGPTYARLYADENKISTDNVANLPRLVKLLKSQNEIQALVFVDDFIGTGDNLCRFLGEFRGQWGAGPPPTCKLVIVAVAGYGPGCEKVMADADRRGLDIEVILGDPLAEEELFGENSEAFPDPSDRVFARAVAEKAGVELLRKWPLGYGDLQSNVVFESSCPNNTLPILWSDSTWFPLFRRK